LRGSSDNAGRLSLADNLGDHHQRHNQPYDRVVHQANQGKQVRDEINRAHSVREAGKNREGKSPMLGHLFQTPNP
jgi:hypothetical protein